MSRKTFLREVEQVIEDLDKPLGPRDMSMDARVVIASLWTNTQWVMVINRPLQMSERFTRAVNEMVAADLARVEKEMGVWRLCASPRLLSYPTHERRMTSQELLDNTYVCVEDEEKEQEG